MTLYLLFMFLLVRTASTVYEPDSHRACQQFTADKAIKNLIVEKQKLITPCPCVKQKIELDYSFEKIGDCYRQRMFENGVKQMCCYSSDGNIQKGVPQGGYMLLEALWKNMSDVQRSCCREENMCDMFYEINPSDDCSAYQPPVIVTSSGDPTIQTIDGASFDFNGHGEYVFLKTDDLEIQVRLGYVTPGNEDSTLFEIFSIFDNKTGETFEVHKSKKDLHVYKNGMCMCNANREGPPSPCENPSPSCIVLAGDGKAVIVGCDVKEFTQSIDFTAGDLMSVSITPNKNAKNLAISGLAGHQKNGSFVCRNDTEINVNSAEPMLFEYGESWSLQNEKESRFNYSLTHGNFTFYNGHHTRPKFLEDLVGNLTELFNGSSPENISLFNVTCRNYWDNTPNEQCLLTIARSKDYKLGQAVMNTTNEAHQRWEILHNTSPHFIEGMPEHIKAVYKNNSNIIINVTQYVWDEDTDHLYYNISTDLLHDEYTLDNGVFTWNVGTSLRYIDTSFTFYVIDRFKSSGSHDVTISYCGCDNPSECNFDTPNSNSSRNVIKAGCECPDYFTGLYCETKLDPCKDHKCFHNCSKDFDRSLESWPCDPCPKGRNSLMTLNEQKCQNIDECDPGYSGEDKCEQNCNDTDGSFVCSCKTGFTLNSNKYSCDDVDECVQPSICEEHMICINNEGSYVCDCGPGYTRKNFNDTCKKISESSTPYVGSIAIIIGIKDEEVDKINKTIDTTNNRNTFKNRLDAVFKGIAGYESVEVTGIIIIKTGARRKKRETDQSYRLSVEYIVHWSNKSDDEKVTKSLQQSFSDYLNKSDAIKIENLPKPIRFAGADVHVNNANETGLCDIENKNDCDPESTDCHDNNHKIECKCKRGFTSAIVTTKFCKDFDECNNKNKTGIPNCSGHGQCSNTIGGYTCDCHEGFQIVKNDTNPWNVTCEDINECHSEEYTCQDGQCLNTIGGWECTCYGSGFHRKSISTGFLCIDIDECSNNSYHCGNGKCNNTDGNWSCTCPPGYKRIETSPSNIQCEEIDECMEFTKNSSIDERCVHGTCVNTAGSWNCSCPPNRLWQNVGNKSYPVYRCQGDYQYIGVIKLLWISTTVQKGQVRDFLNKTIESLFSMKNRSFENGSPYMHEVFLSVEYLNATFNSRTSGFVHITALYILHLGESVTPEWIEEFQLNAFKSKGFKSKNGTVVNIIGSSIFNESGENLCNITNKTKCDLKSTTCSVQNGSYSCACKSGFHVRIDDHYCKDIDECKDNRFVCGSGTCSNTVGSWECMCNETSSFRRINDSYGVCEDKDECKDERYICQHGNCTNIPGGWMCVCQTGYSPQEIVRNKIYTCTDKDECKNDATCSTGGSCINLPGNWTCECPLGFKNHYINQSFINCTDVNECKNGATCSNGGSCVNIPGSWECNCPSGFEKHEINETFVNCTDINECKSSDFSCEGDNNSSRCENVPGSWKCACLKGYEANNFSDTHRVCEDIDECRDDIASCKGGECRNTVGGWYCECADGFTNTSAESSGYNAICTDIDECVTTLKDISCLEASECVNTVGSWKCICSDGFTENVINKTSKTCEGDYQYVASVSFSLTGEITDVSEIKKAIQKKIMAMYVKALDDSSVWIEILKIIGLPETTRRKRSIPQHEIKTEYVVHSTAEKTKDELNNVETVYRKDHSCDNETVECDDKIGDFPIQFAKIQTKNNSAICETNKNDCDRTTTCVSTNGQLECNCTIKYPKRESRTNCIDPCQKSKCHETSTCSHGNNEDGYICGCGKGRKGDYCTEIDHEYKKQQTTLIAVGSSLGGLVLVLAVVIFGLCRWRAAKIKEAEKIAMRPMDSSGFKTFDNTFPSNQYMRNSRDDVDSLYSHRLSNVSIPRVQQNGDLYRHQNGHISTSLYAKPIKLPKPHLRGSQHLLGSMPNLAYGDAEFYPSDYRRRSDQYPNRFSGSYDHALSASYNDLRNVNGRTSPLPDYDRLGSPKPYYRADNRSSYDVTRPRSPRPDYNRRERIDASKDSGVGNGYSGDSNDFKRTDQRRGYPNEYRHSDTRF